MIIHVYAQEAETILPRENIQIIVTTSTIDIDTNFAGRDLYIAGVLENADPQLRLQGRYDVIVVMEGPIRSMVIRQKKRKAGLWVNADSMTFVNVPLFYSMATTREKRDMASPETYRRLGLGLSYLPLRAYDADDEKFRVFRDELIMLKNSQNLYNENIGAVTFGSSSLFTAHFRLPANVPVGQHKVHAYLFRDGQFIQMVTTELEIEKAHIAFTIFRAAHVHSFWYGTFAVLIAILTGFIGRLVFRKD
ncbi:TIGR02186 family protein [Bartonella tamiae]|uniref:TIGR02186 family protein n=1 Tax=Bartonella tamiae Th239 TaxID=1094558 RepID=J1JYX9_9HYPH|nr:TIGR02186 family protein [Bartonella tamiae]EJF90312.1 hypothetical protein ME5_00713 [Bartonella tamiae Th239]EJF93747.1 hypothetical protein MEG_01171 [Bartonella tamiae Th307]